MFNSKLATYGLYALILAAVAVSVYLLVSYLMRDSYEEDEGEEFLGFLEDEDEEPYMDDDDEDDYEDDDDE